MKFSPAVTTALLVPVGIGLSFISPILLSGMSGATTLAIRLPMVLAILTGIGAALTGLFLYRTELRWIALLSLYLLFNMIVFLNLPGDPEQPLLDLGRQAFVAVFSAGLLLVLRRQEARVALYRGAAIATWVGLLLIALLYVQQYGVSLQLSSLNSFKYIVAERYGLALNPLSFATIVCALLSFPLWGESRWVAAGGLSAILASLILSGSRTSLMSFLLTVVLFLGIVFIRRFALPWRVASLTILMGAAVFAFSRLSLDRWNIDPTAASEVTTGRLDLWVAAWQKFLDRPWFGWGANTWSEDLVVYLPGYAHYWEGLLSLEAGAFHNMYLTVLAEKGILVFITAMLLLLALTRMSWSVYDHRRTLPVLEGRAARIAPFVVLLLLIRGLGEQPGLFGYAIGAVDFLSYIVAVNILALETLRCSQGVKPNDG